MNAAIRLRARRPAQVNKGVLLLQVDFQQGATPCAAADMDILERLQVLEVEVSRYNPGKHRDDWEALLPPEQRS